MSPSEHRGPESSWLTTEHPPDNTTERHLQDLRDAAGSRRVTEERAARERPAAGSGPPMPRPKDG